MVVNFSTNTRKKGNIFCLNIYKEDGLNILNLCFYLFGPEGVTREQDNA